MTPFIIKELTKKHLTQYNDLLRYAFQITSRQLNEIGWDEDEIRDAKSPVLEKATVFGWFDDDILASQIALYPMHVNIHGKIFDMTGITGVATYPEYAGKGLMKRLMQHSLDFMRKNKQSVSFLYPYSIPYYRRMGWEIISDKMYFRLKDTQLPKPISGFGQVARVAKDDTDFLELYNEFAHQRHGALIRNSLAWEEYWRWDVDDTTVALYYNKADKATGYLVYLLEDEVLRIKELVYLDEEAWHGLWNYISAHFSMVNEVSGAQYTSEPLAFLMEDSEIKETIRPYFMARIVDVVQFIEQYPFLPRGTEEEFTLQITDTMADWNCGSFLVNIDAEGAASCVPGATGKNVVTLDIGTLCTMLLSYKRPSYLHRIERLRADKQTLQILERTIPQDVPYFSDYF